MKLLKGDDYTATDKLVGECASRVYSTLMHQQIEPDTKEVFHAYVDSASAIPLRHSSATETYGLSHDKNELMNSKMDPMGRAIADYYKEKQTSKLRVFSPMFEEDEIPLTTLFRSYESMPDIERKALDMAKGRVLDVGAGSDCHSLVLQERSI